MRSPPPRHAFAVLLSLATGAQLALWGGACGQPAPSNPFPFDGGSGGGAGAGGGDGAGGSFDAGTDADPTLGGPCSVDSQCDDGHDCTFDACDTALLRCRFTPDDSQCQNGQFCDGIERCDNKLGCRAGEPVSCSDGNACTINSCDESRDSCLSQPRDADEDGDPDDHCGGGDCDDNDPLVSSLETEICANQKDDNCDGSSDESNCGAPQYDTCLTAFSLPQPGSYAFNTAAAKLDYSSSCTVEPAQAARELVTAVLLAPGVPRDVQLTATSPFADVSLALMGQCAQASSQLACAGGYAHPGGGRVSKVRVRGVGDSNQAVAIANYLTTATASDVTLRYEVLPASSKPSNETCGSAVVLLPSQPTSASIVDAATDVALGCGAATGELLYRFTLTEARDVNLFAASADGDGLPVISLRDSGCALPGDEITCNVGAAAHIFRHALPAGDYYVAVAATAPTDVSVTLELSPPTAPPADETCTGAPTLTPNQTIAVSLLNHQDDVDSGCLVGGTDAVYTLDLTQPSDVLLVGRFSQGDNARVALVLPACADASDGLVCGAAAISPARAQLRNLAAGSYRVVAESTTAQPMQLTALVRPALPPTIVPFADSCGDILAIPATGGFFQGTTANAQANYNAGCDVGAQPPGGAPDQLLSLTLSSEKRVIFDMQGSAYATLLNIREGSPCPGNEVLGACAAGYYPSRSYLDVTLPAATYTLQIDGYSGQSGAWFLDVHVIDP